MVSPRDIKKNIRTVIMESLNRDGVAMKDVLIASFKLETGFGKHVIQGILDDLVLIDQIKIDGNEIRLANSK